MPKGRKIISLLAAIAFLGIAGWMIITRLFNPGPPVSIPFGAQSFVVGVNYPWVNYGGDFGDSFWGHLGVSTAATGKIVESDFAELQKEKVTFIRWFLFADGHGGIHFNQDGSVYGLDQDVFTDIDAALAIAARHNIRIMFVLVDFKFFEGEPYGTSGRNWGGHEVIVTSKQARQSFLDKVVRPLAERYANESTIAAWEVINEPEWEIGKSFRWGRKEFSVGQMQTFISSVADTIHKYGKQPVTLGSVDHALLKLWTHVGLDFYQVHSYPYTEVLDPLPASATLQKLDKPCLLGEFPTSYGKNSVRGYLDRAKQDGFAGAFAWSYRAGDNYSNYRSVRGTISQWIKNH